MVIEAADVIEQMVKVTDEFRDSRQIYMSAHHTFSKERDARITIFSRFISSLDVALLYFMFRTFHVLSEPWWTDIIPNELEKNKIKITWIPLDEPNRKELKIAMDNYWAFSLFILLFSTLESSVRAIVRVVYPSKFNDGRSPIATIYRDLLSDNYSEYHNLLKLFRLCRNTSHNNGVYFPEKQGDDENVTFKDVTYHFIDGKPVELGDVPRLLFFDVIPELLKMVIDIVNAKDVSMHDQIIDPSAPSHAA